ncbi:MAG: kinase to dihydroxyacetone kinase [Clostridia bacterium]|nr:kinase to dihydroxyacetone kinase [Clostridia bacterium]
MIEFKYDTQLLIDGKNLDDISIRKYIEKNFKGDSLLVVGDDEMIKIHFHTNKPWEILEYCSALGEIYDIVVEDMDRQTRGLQG